MLLDWFEVWYTYLKQLKYIRRIKNGDGDRTAFRDSNQYCYLLQLVNSYILQD